MTINGDTIPRAFFALETTLPHRPGKDRLALITKQGNDALETTLRRLQEQVRELAAGLITLGIEAGERVAIDLDNGPEWIISDLAISSIGAVTVPIYTTLGRDEKVFILNDSQASAIILQAENKADFKPALSKLPCIRHIISAGNNSEEKNADINDFSLHGLQLMGKVSNNPEKLKERIEAATPDDPFSIIYSSGTTGRPKGVVLSHANILSNIEASLKVLDIRSEEDLYLSYLPLSHGFERMVHYLLILNTTPIAYSKGLISVSADLQFFKPTFMIGVPFFFEKIKKKIMHRAATSGTIKRTLFKAAFAAKPGKEHSIANALVFKKIKEKIGTQLRYFVSGGAPLSTETTEFFSKIGLPILEGYGLTETSPVISVNTLEDNRPGTVGRPLPGTEVKLGEDGEILVRGPGVMRGYHNMTEATAKAIRDGWLHTEDIGVIDDGFITITDRKKDIIITSAGKNIAPQRIETILKADEYIKEALVYGNGKTHIVALIVPNKERLEELKAMATTKDGKLIFTDPAVHAFFEKKIKTRLEGLADFERIKKFALIADDLTLDAGEVTPTLKVKRSKVGARYSELLDSLYG